MQCISIHTNDQLLIIFIFGSVILNEAGQIIYIIIWPLEDITFPLKLSCCLSYTFLFGMETVGY